LGGPLSDIPDRLTALVEREGSVDHRRDLAGFDEVLQHNQVLAPWLGQERARRLQAVLRASYLHQPPLVEEAMGRQALALLRQLEAACTSAEELAAATIA
jgi:hypothetical protein